MRINGSYGNFGVNSIYTSIYQNNMAMFSNKMNKSLLSFGKDQGKETLGSSAIGYITNIKTSSKELGNTMKALSGSAFTSRTMTSSNSELMTVDYTGNKLGNLSPMTVKIDQIATGQQNEGNKMDSAEKYGGTAGANQFTIETGGKTTQLSVNVTAGDTNKEVQQKMADAINTAGAGVKATVETDSKTNTSTLKLEATKTGSDPKNAFTIKDVKGDLIAQTGADKVEAKGKDAIYSVNGGAAKTSQLNTVNLGNGISATFKKASDETVTISQGKNLDSIKSAVESMVKSYNNLYSEAAQRTGDMKAQNLATKMVNTSKVYAGSLSSIGIGFDNDGKMAIDAKQLNQAAESGKLERFFTENSGMNYGFTNQISKLADNVTRNTSNYVDNKLFGSELGANFSYSGFGDLIQYNYLSAGSIFDYSF